MPCSAAAEQGVDEADSRVEVSEEERRKASLAALGSLIKEHDEIALSRLATLHEAKLLLKAGSYDEAIAAYKKFASSKAPEPLRLTAMEGVGYSLEAKALANEEFELYYQPLVNLKSGRISTCEALLRWQHPQRGMIYPGQFLSIAEETGVINEISSWLLQEACRQNRTWRDSRRRRLSRCAGS